MADFVFLSARHTCGVLDWLGWMDGWQFVGVRTGWVESLSVADR